MARASDKNAAFDVVVLGPVTQDLTVAIERIPPTAGSARARCMREAPGGKGANPAVACARLGARTALVGAVGDDKLGRRLRKQLKKAGVDVRLVQRRPDQVTGRIVHLVEPDGQRRFIELLAANDSVPIDAAKLRLALGTDSWLLMSTAMPVAPLIEAAEVATDAGARVALDLAGPPATSEALLRHADLVRVDSSEAEALTGTPVTDFDSAAAAARWLQVRGPDIVVVQAGGEGNLLRFHTDELRVPVVPSATVDPTGAGDAFVATLLVRLATGDEPGRAAALASVAAAHTAGQLGGTPRFDLITLESLV